MSSEMEFEIWYNLWVLCRDFVVNMTVNWTDINRLEVMLCVVKFLKDVSSAAVIKKFEMWPL